MKSFIDLNVLEEKAEKLMVKRVGTAKGGHWEVLDVR